MNATTHLPPEAPGIPDTQGTQDTTRTPAGLPSRRSVRCANLVIAFRPPTAETLDLLRDWYPGSLRAMQTEYTRLFVNAPGGPVAPAEALGWLGPDPVAGSTYLEELRRAYLLEGLEMARDAGLPADHLAVLLEFLLGLQLDEEAGMRKPGHADRFRQRFLDGWVSRFADTLDRAEPVPFYRRAARELRVLVEPAAGAVPPEAEGVR